jgi:hypothetical protein
MDLMEIFNLNANPNSTLGLSLTILGIGLNLVFFSMSCFNVTEDLHNLVINLENNLPVNLENYN